jgi:hypothetical protein
LHLQLAVLGPGAVVGAVLPQHLVDELLERGLLVRNLGLELIDDLARES